ncbi:MAG: MOSC domain-containing protein [Pseudomonadota bacterium]
MTIEHIFTHAAGATSQSEQPKVQVVAGDGIVGDRYFGKHKEPGQNLTFVEAEEIESFLQEFQRPHDLSITGRNVVTRGVRLNELVGKEFVVGSVRFRGIELCEPCSTLGKRLESPELPAAQIVKRLVHRAGLRADVLTSGYLAAGDSFSQ